MTLSELPDWARAMLEDARVARLGYLDADDLPRVLPVTFAAAQGAVWSSVDEKPKRSAELARVRWLRRRPDAALTVDRYSDNWGELAWVELLGRVEVLDPADGPAGIDALAEKYEPYRERRPPGPLLRLEVERVLWWRAAGEG